VTEEEVIDLMDKKTSFCGRLKKYVSTGNYDFYCLVNYTHV